MRRRTPRAAGVVGALLARPSTRCHPVKAVSPIAVRLGGRGAGRRIVADAAAVNGDAESSEDDRAGGRGASDELRRASGGRHVESVSLGNAVCDGKKAQANGAPGKVADDAADVDPAVMRAASAAAAGAGASTKNATAA